MIKKKYPLTPFARKLRRSLTDTEKHLWKLLRSKQLSGFKFRRQVPIGTYIVDFVCFENKVIIECDGSQHIENKEQDQRRDKWLQSQGFKILRFWDNIVFKEIEPVLDKILDVCQKNSPSPQSSPIKGEEVM